jgi:hypothetical protein
MSFRVISEPGPDRDWLVYSSTPHAEPVIVRAPDPDVARHLAEKMGVQASGHVRPR